MIKDIKRTMNVFCSFFIIYIFTLPFVSSIVQHFDKNRNVLMITSSIWMSLLILIPTSYILKVSPLKANVESKNKTSIFEISIMILFFWALYRIIIFSSIQVPIIRKIIVPSDNSIIIFEHSSFIIRVLLFSFALVIEELLFRGVFLNKLRIYGDIFAVIVSSVVFSLIHYKTSIVVIFAGLLIGIIYVISNNISAAIILHALINLGTVFIEELGTYNEIFIFYGILFGICLIIFLVDKRFRKTFIALRNKYNEESSYNKGKYNVAFKSEGFLLFAMIIGIVTVSALVS